MDRSEHSIWRSHRDELESTFTSSSRPSVPSGIYRGRFLTFVDSAGARRARLRLMVNLGFRALPFGVDFDRRLWFWFGTALAMGRFEPRVQRSRWRDGEVVALHYDRSRLPRMVRRHLYDEIVPLGRDRILGLGGINAERDRGDLFFFALERESGVQAQPVSGRL